MHFYIFLDSLRILLVFKNGQIWSNISKILFHSLSAAICAGLLQFEKKKRRKKNYGPRVSRVGHVWSPLNNLKSSDIIALQLIACTGVQKAQKAQFWPKSSMSFKSSAL